MGPQPKNRPPTPAASQSPKALDERIRAGREDLYLRTALNLVPFLLLCYIFAMVDRLNVGYAKLQFMADLHFDEAVFGVAAGILYVGYILFEVPSNLLLERAGLRITLLRIMTLWGLFTMAMAFAATRWHFYGLRFLVGAAEAGFFPGVLYYFTLWFPEDWRARITSIFALGVPVSGIVAAPVSGWIMIHMAGVSGLRGWQWLFLIEGAPAIVLGVVAYCYLPDRPADARFLSSREKAAIERERAQDAAIVPGADTFGQALRNPRALVLALVYFAFFSIQSILLLWMPTLLRNAGVANLAEIGWRTALIFAAGAIGMAAMGWSSDRHKERRWTPRRLRRRRQPRSLSSAARGAKSGRHDAHSGARIAGGVRLSGLVLDRAGDGSRKGRPRRRNCACQFGRRARFGAHANLHGLDPSPDGKPFWRDCGDSVGVSGGDGGALPLRAGRRHFPNREDGATRRASPKMSP